MRYLFLGDSLGGKPADRSCYDHRGKPDYPKIRSKGFFKAGQLESSLTFSLVFLPCF